MPPNHADKYVRSFAMYYQNLNAIREFNTTFLTLSIFYVKTITKF